LAEWLQKIDPGMVQYKGILEEFHYDTEKTLATLTTENKDLDAMGIKGGHKQLLLKGSISIHSSIIHPYSIIKT
jgi:hypothetical protein